MQSKQKSQALKRVGHSFQYVQSFDSVVALLAAVIICSTGVANWKQIQESTDWGVLMLFGGGLTLSAVLKDSGASKVLADGIVFLVQGQHYYLIGLLVATFIIFLTEFTSNTASAALLVPIFISIAQSLGMPEILQRYYITVSILRRDPGIARGLLEKESQLVALICVFNSSSLK